MNVFFTAQKQNVVIDVCSLDQDLSLLQQGCDITNGLYLRIPQLQGLLQYLLVKLYIIVILWAMKIFSLVGVSSRAPDKTKNGRATFREGRLQSSLFLPQRIDRYWICVFRVLIEYVTSDSFI